MRIRLMNPMRRTGIVLFIVVATGMLLVVDGMVVVPEAWTTPLSVVSVFVTFVDGIGVGDGVVVDGVTVVGMLVVTLLFNVPLNNRLAKVAPDSAEGATLWSHYLKVWTGWNHPRTIGCLGALGSFILGMP